MARVYNWQIGREMSYWYPESRPKRQFARGLRHQQVHRVPDLHAGLQDDLDVGQGAGVHALEQRRDEAVRLLPAGLGPEAARRSSGRRPGRTAPTRAGRSSRPRAAGERVLGWRPEDVDYAYPNVGEDDCTGSVDGGAAFSLPHMSWFFYLARICNHCTYPACLASCPRGSIYKRPEDGIVLVDQSRCRGYQECVKACPYKKVFYNPMTGTSEKCIACFPKIEQGLQPQCFVNCIGKIRLAGFVNPPDRLATGQSDRLPRARTGRSRCRCSRSSGSSRTSTTSRRSTCPRRSCARCSDPAQPQPWRPTATRRTTPTWPGCSACSAPPNR